MKILNKIKKFWAQNLSFFLILLISTFTFSLAILASPAEDGSRTFDGRKAVISKELEEQIKEARIILASESKKAILEISGQKEELDVPTIESVDSSKSTKDEETEVGGRGWSVDTSSVNAFRSATIGKCVDTDGAYGSQCWDLGNLFWRNYAGRSLNTCGTGAAKGTIGNGCWQRNAGNEFDMIWDKNQIRAGDWVVFNNGAWGHIGMALGGNNNGYVALLGTNQGGVVCAGGGSATNIINISLNSFAGAFRPKKYATVSSSANQNSNVAQSVKSNNSVTSSQNIISNSYTVKQGDTLGGIALKNGWYSGGALFGDAGYAESLAKKNGISNRGLIFPGQVISR